MFSEITWTQPTFIMTVGMPGSGKSRVGAQLLEVGPRNIARIASDTIIEKSAEANGLTYREMFPLFADKKIRQFLLNQIVAAAEKRQHILLEQCNLNAETRKRYLSLIPQEYQRVALHCRAPWGQVLRVNDNRRATGRNVPYDALCGMWAAAEDPKESEGIDLILEMPFQK